MRALLVLPASLPLALLLPACPSEAPPDDDDDDDDDGYDDDDDDDDGSPEPTPGPKLELLSYELTDRDGTMDRGEDDAESVFHAARFWTGTPLRVWAVEAMFNVPNDSDEEAHLAIWPDEGHNFFDFLREAPLAEWEPELDPDLDDNEWVRFDLDEPLDFPYPALLWVGSHYRGDDEQPVLDVDGEVTLDPFLQDKMSDQEWHFYTPHLAVYPDRGTDAYGFEYVQTAGNQGRLYSEGDLMVRVWVERYDIVADTWFHERQGEVAAGGTGLLGSGNVSFADCDDDGWIDVWDGRLRVNQGDGTFVDVTDGAGIVPVGPGSWGDFDDDGDADLFLSNQGAGLEAWDLLYRNEGDCTFTDVTAASGIDDSQEFDSAPAGEPIVQHVPTPASAWVDVDGDGLLDLVQANFLDFESGDGAIDRLWLNQGDGAFVDGTEAWGMRLPEGSGLAGRGVAPADWDNDGDMDVYISNYRLHRNLAWRNEGDHFVDAGDGNALEGHESPVTFVQSYWGHTIGSVWGDLDNDGDLDLFAANLAHPRFIAFSDMSMLLRNRLVEDGAESFEEMRDAAGMIYQETDSSPLLLDYDLDGDLDLFYTAVYPARPSYLYRNNGDFTFTMVSYPAGTWIWSGWGAAPADIDNDGDEDIYGAKLFQNDFAPRGNWIKVEARGLGAGFTNRSGIGARIHVTTEAGTQLREVGSGIGTGCQAPFEQTIGIGAAASALVEVDFPLTGTLVDVGPLEAGARVVVSEDGLIVER